MRPRPTILLLASLFPFLATSEPQAAQGSVDEGPVILAWGDADGDGRLDLAAVRADGALCLLVQGNAGGFDDATERAGLASVTGATLVLWGDHDHDGRLDLFVGARGGASRLFRNEGGAFVDVSASSGLVCAGDVRAAQWLDAEGDGNLDLLVVTPEANLLFHALEGGFFQRAELELARPVKGGARLTPGASAVDLQVPRGGRAPTAQLPGGRLALGPTAGIGKVAQLTPFPLACANALRDQASPGTCLEASTNPTLGQLYPLSQALFVDADGHVGLGTTSPAARLEVAGDARIGGTLELQGPERALDLVTGGSLYRGGSAFLHARGPWGNLALGADCMPGVTSGARNTASGTTALYLNSSGSENTAFGFEALISSETGSGNTACGSGALRSVSNGSYNTALGQRAGVNLTIGSHNVAIANEGVAGESDTIRIGTAGTQTRAFLAGVRGVTTGSSDAIPVLIDGAGQLGTLSSSRRFKEEIRDMGTASARLSSLRPVVFRYRSEVQAGERPLEFGLIAEEVAEVFPELVVRDEQGQPLTVKYHLLSALLLNELQRTQAELEALRRELEGRVAALEAR